MRPRGALNNCKTHHLGSRALCTLALMACKVKRSYSAQKKALEVVTER